MVQHKHPVALMVSVVHQALELAEGRVNELTASLTDAQLQFECAEKHRALALRQLDAQEEDFGKLGRHLQKVSPQYFITPPSLDPYGFLFVPSAAPFRAFTTPPLQPNMAVLASPTFRCPLS